MTWGVVSDELVLPLADALDRVTSIYVSSEFGLSLRTPLFWIDVRIMMTISLGFWISCIWLIRNTSIGFLYQLIMRGNSSSQLIIDGSAPSLGLVPINRLLAWTTETLPLV